MLVASRTGVVAYTLRSYYRYYVLLLDEIAFCRLLLRKRQRRRLFLHISLSCGLSVVCMLYLCLLLNRVTDL